METKMGTKGKMEAKSGVGFRVLDKEEFEKLFNASGGSKNDYDKLREILTKHKGKCLVFSFQELSSILGCKASSGAMRNIQRTAKEKFPDLIATIKVNTKAQLIGFVLK